jgi:hypothetical protein
MRHNGLVRYYDRLIPEDHFRLDVLAMFWGGVEESEILTRTCQRETYTMNHRGYTARWTGTYEITLRMYIAINNELSKLQMIDAFRELVPYSQALSHNIAFDAYVTDHESGSCHTWGYANMEGCFPQWSGDGTNGEVMDPKEDKLVPAMERDSRSSARRWRSTASLCWSCWASWSAISPRTPSVCGRASPPFARRVWALRRRT